MKKKPEGRVTIVHLESLKYGTDKTINQYINLMKGLSTYIQGEKLSLKDKILVTSMIPQFINNQTEGIVQLRMRINGIGLTLEEVK